MTAVTDRLPMSAATWDALVDVNRKAMRDGWAEEGVFATGIGPDYKPGGILYVGKSAGPLGTAVGSGHDQALSSQASTRWMVGRCNRSAFWQMIDKVDPTRRTIAWTNICKMDERGGQRPPSRQWGMIAGPHMAALSEEIAALQPGVILLATSGYCGTNVRAMLDEGGFEAVDIDLEDGMTRVSRTSGGQAAIETRHPQGWPSVHRDRVVGLVREILSVRRRAA